MEDLCNSVNQYFPKDQYMILQNQAQINKSLPKWKADEYILMNHNMERLLLQFRFHTRTNLRYYCLSECGAVSKNIHTIF